MDDVKRYFFVRSDAISISGQVWSAGQVSVLWSAFTNVNAKFQDSFLLHFNVAAVNPTYLSSRYNGFPLRCLVR